MGLRCQVSGITLLTIERALEFRWYHDEKLATGYWRLISAVFKKS
jgi:hypothetical protein